MDLEFTIKFFQSSCMSFLVVSLPKILYQNFAAAILQQPFFVKVVLTEVKMVQVSVQKILPKLTT